MQCNMKRVLLLVAACAVIGQATGVLYEPHSEPKEHDSPTVVWDIKDGFFTFAGRNITTLSRANKRACLVLASDFDAINSATTLPTSSRDQPAICPLFADYKPDLGYEIHITSGISKLPDVVAEIERELTELLASFNPQPTGQLLKLTDMLMITWEGISTGCNTEECKNTFQLVIAVAGKSTYLVLNYGTINSSGLSGSLSSLAGINLGDNQGFEHLPLSNLPFNKIRRLTEFGSSAVLGRYFYRISTHRPQRLGCLDSNLFPDVSAQPLTLSTYNMDIYGGHRLLVQGPCFRAVSDKINCAFSRLSSQGEQIWEYSTLYQVDNYTGVCLSLRTPKIDLGWTTIAVSLTNNTNWHFKSPVYITAPSDNEMPVKIEGDKASWLSVSPSTRVAFSWSASAFGNVAVGTGVQYHIVGYKNVDGNVVAVEYPPFNSAISANPTYAMQRQDIDLKNVMCENDCDGVAIGQIVIRLVSGVHNTSATRFEISSPIIPIGWYTYYRNDGNQISNLCKANLGEQLTPLSCPCALRVVKAETSKFIPAPDCGTDGKNCFYSESAECYVTTPNQNAGVRCCYATSGGHLLYGQDLPKRGSYTTQYAPLTSSPQTRGTSATVSYALSHLVPYAACCVWPGSESKECHVYGIRHAVSSNCFDYQVSGISAIVGDPHFITPDLSTVTFNGYGEYWFLKPSSTASNAARIQVRLNMYFGSSTTTEPAAMQATVLSAIVLEQGSDKIEIQMRTKSLQQTKKLHLFYNGTEKVFFDLREQVYGGLRVSSSGGDQSEINVISFNDGTSLKCIYENVAGFSHMKCIVFVQASLKNQTTGLIGNWNGVAEDDLTKQGSTDVYSLTNLTAVNDAGQTWSVKTDETLFTTRDPPLTNSFTPMLTYKSDNPECMGTTSDAAKQTCNYDFSVTGSSAYAGNTRTHVDQFINQRSELYNQKNTEYCPYLDITGATKEFTNGYQANSRVTVTGCKPGYQFVGSRTEYVCDGGQWTPEPTTLCTEIAMADAGSDMLVIIIVCSVVGGLLLIALIVGGIIFWRKKRSQKADDNDDEADGNLQDEVRMDPVQPTPVYGQQQPTYGQQRQGQPPQQPVYGQQRPVYGQQQPVYAQQQEKIYGEGQQKVYGETQQRVPDDKKIYGPGQMAQTGEYGQFPRPPTRPDEYGRLPPTQPRSDYAPPPVAPRQQPGYGGVRVLPATGFTQAQGPNKATGDTDSSESEEESDDERQGTADGSDV